MIPRTEVAVTHRAPIGSATMDALKFTPIVDEKRAATTERRILVGVGIFGAIVIAFGIFVAVTTSGDEDVYSSNNSLEAIAQCEDLVQAELKAPSTAKFDSTATGFGEWTVTGTVDSENSFGAMLRSEYQCTVIIEGESIKRRLDSLG